MEPVTGWRWALRRVIGQPHRARGWLGRRLLAEELRRLEEALAAASEQAAQTDQHLSAMEDQLRHADRLSTVGHLASSVAHELGSPLNVVRIHGQELASGELGPAPELSASGQQIVEQCDRMAGLLRRLLQMARAQPGLPEPLDPGPLAEGILALLRPLARKRGVQFQLHLDGPIPRVMAIRSELQQVLLNLCLNGIQAMPAGGELAVELGPGVLDSGPALCLTVRDTGEGIPEATRARIFEPFFTTKPEGQGTGLGLSVSAGIIAEHGGAIRVDSLPGAGSRFHVLLPIHKDG